MSGFNIFISFFIILIIVVYFFAFYIVILKRDMQRQMVRRFHNAICNIYH